MCGLMGILSTGPVRLSDSQCCRLRDLLSHRGPDGAGLWRGGFSGTPGPEIVLGHRRLAVLDPSPAGGQPMATPDGRFVLVYNGELYNEPALRAQLQHEGVRFHTTCDTETVLWWLATRGTAGLHDLRGMFAIAMLDRLERRVLMARDPLGVKPLYWWRGRPGGEDVFVFASEPGPILAHPAVTAEPDLVAVSAYLTTSRSVLGERTMFEGVRSLVPGGAVTIDYDGTRFRAEFRTARIPRTALPQTPEARIGMTREVVGGSVQAHLRADVPTCCLLSGGLDSAIITRIAGEVHGGLRTYCAGAKDEAAIDGVPQSEDFRFAAELSATMGTQHTEAVVDEVMFGQRWAEMVARQGVPLSTPNEVAINEVARRLRRDGCVVTLSGEGADELFGGYHHVLGPAAGRVAAGNAEPGMFHLMMSSWCRLDEKPHVLTDESWEAAGRDEWLADWFTSEFDSIRADDEPMADHMRFQRRVNLAGLLQRLDSATMLESVEGRTPFADVGVAAFAESLPASERFMPPDRTKRVLREAFGTALPASVVQRPKASFPLPFQRWIGGHRGTMSGSDLLKSIVRPDVLSMVTADPAACWHLAWPLCNLALWAERWWPDGRAANPRSGVTASVS